MNAHRKWVGLVQLADGRSFLIWKGRDMTAIRGGGSAVAGQ